MFLASNWYYNFDGDCQIYSGSSQNSKFAVSLQYLKGKVRDEVDFLNPDEDQSFLQVGFNTLNITGFYKLILSLLIDMV